jgi:hypothetical protein
MAFRTLGRNPAPPSAKSDGLFGLSPAHRTASRLNHARKANGPPVARRHMLQWQKCTGAMHLRCNAQIRIDIGP